MKTKQKNARCLENIIHLQQEIVMNLFIMAEEQYPFLMQKHGIFSSKTLNTQKILTSSNEMFNLKCLRIALAFC